MADVQDWLNHLDNRKEPAWYHEDCVFCMGNGCDECTSLEEEMTTYQVTIDFKGGASFGTQVQALTPGDAKMTALRIARQCGFGEPVKKNEAVERVSA